MFNDNLKINLNLRKKSAKSKIKYFENIFYQIEEIFSAYLKKVDIDLKNNKFLSIKKQIREIVKIKEKKKN